MNELRKRKKRGNKKNGFNSEKNSAEEAKRLAYCRKFFSKYFRDNEIKGVDPDINNFIQKFQEVIVPYFQKKTFMTLEEEASETHMNAVLRQKIKYLRDQI